MAIKISPIRILIVALLGWTLLGSDFAMAKDKSPEKESEVSPKLKKAAKKLRRKIAKEDNSVKKSIQLRSLGVLQYMMGYKADAEESFKQAIAIDPELKFNFKKVKNKGVKRLWIRVKKQMNRKRDGDMFAGSVEASPPKKPQQVATLNYAPPPDRAALARQRTLEKFGSKSTTSDYILASLPFGSGQFNNGDYLLGLTFLMTQGFAAVHWNQLMVRKSEYEQRRSEVLADLAAGGADEAAINSYSNEADTYIDALQQRSNIALGSFFTLWVASSGEAMYTIYKRDKARSKFEMGLTPRGPAIGYSSSF